MYHDRKSGFLGKNRVVFLPVGKIAPNPDQPRKVFDRGELESLARSIAIHGILQPISVRRTEQGYTLVAGERRLRAAKLAELSFVPCIILEVDEQDAGLLALVENLQRRDLDFWEEAKGLERMMKTYGLSQEETARHIGKSQSAVANKLRLLRHSPEVLEILRQGSLTERHGRALLRVEDPRRCLALARQAAAEGWSVARLEEVIDREPRPRSLWKDVGLRDVRLFLNAVEHSLQAVRHAGIPARCGREERNGEIVLTIYLPKIDRESSPA